MTSEVCARFGQRRSVLHLGQDTMKFNIERIVSEVQSEREKSVRYAVHFHGGGVLLTEIQPFGDRMQVQTRQPYGSIWEPQSKKTASLRVTTYGDRAGIKSKCRRFSWLQPGLAITFKERYNIKMLERHDIWRVIDGDRTIVW